MLLWPDRHAASRATAAWAEIMEPTMQHHLRAALLVTAVLLVGCARSGEPTYLSAVDTDAEYLAASTKLVLPDGVSFADPNHPAVAGDGNEILYEAGSGRNDAQYFWYCAWAATAVSAADPTQALANLERAHSMELWNALDDNGRTQFADQLALAKTGDLSQIDWFVEANCSLNGT
jgi:hypothetical protein